MSGLSTTRRRPVGGFGSAPARCAPIGVSAVAVLVRQLRSALLGLLATTAIVSYFVGERSRPSPALTLAALAGVATAILLSYPPLAAPLGFTPLPASYRPIVTTLVVVYLALVEMTKRAPFTPADLLRAAPVSTAPAVRRMHRRAARFTTRARSQTTRHG